MYGQGRPYKSEIISEHIFDMMNLDSSISFYGPFDIDQAEEFEKQQSDVIQFEEHNNFHQVYQWDCKYCNQ
jgi:hypothetical protein